VDRKDRARIESALEEVSTSLSGMQYVRALYAFEVYVGGTSSADHISWTLILNQLVQGLLDHPYHPQLLRNLDPRNHLNVNRYPTPRLSLPLSLQTPTSHQIRQTHN
jgi:hypothetical protein